MSGILYIVSTPIGNLEDISLRALRVLRDVALIAAEDARITGELLRFYQIQTEVVSYRPRRSRLRKSPPHSLFMDRTGRSLTTPPDTEIGREESLSARIKDMLASGLTVALVCDAGTPTLADPGGHLIHAALAWGAKVVPVPGATAALAALVVSGLPTGRFAFDGFPPRARADRQAFFALLKGETRTLILYETRAYLRSTLNALAATLGQERCIALGRNLTAPSETLFRGTLAEALTYLQPQPPRGEYVLVVSPGE